MAEIFQNFMFWPRYSPQSDDCAALNLVLIYWKLKHRSNLFFHWKVKTQSMKQKNIRKICHKSVDKQAKNEINLISVILDVTFFIF